MMPTRRVKPSGALFRGHVLAMIRTAHTSISLTDDWGWVRESSSLRRGLLFVACWLLAIAARPTTAIEHILQNDRYRLRLADDCSVEIRAKAVRPQTLLPELTVMRSAINPGFHINHRNYFIAPRTAIRWSAYQRELTSLNRWLNSARMLRATGKESILVTEGEAGDRTWVYRYPDGRTKTVEGLYAQGTIDPFEAGERLTLLATQGVTQADQIRWGFEGQPAFDLEAHLVLPPGDEEPRITWQLSVKQEGYYSVAFTGAPRIPAAQLVHVPSRSAAGSIGCSGTSCRSPR